MKISTKGRYALRLMIDLGLNYDGDPVKLKDVAKRQEISEKYLEQIIASLNKVGFVISSRGAYGGYKLAKKPSEYNAYDILTVIEGDLAPVECLCKNAMTCTRMSTCATIAMWKELYSAIKNVLSKYTIEDLMQMAKENQLDFII